MSHLTALAGVDPVVFPAGPIPTDDAHVLGVGQRVGGVEGGRGRLEPWRQSGQAHGQAHAIKTQRLARNAPSREL